MKRRGKIFKKVVTSLRTGALRGQTVMGLGILSTKKKARYLIQTSIWSKKRAKRFLMILVGVVVEDLSTLMISKHSPDYLKTMTNLSISLCLKASNRTTMRNFMRVSKCNRSRICLKRRSLTKPAGTSPVPSLKCLRMIRRQSRGFKGLYKG